MTIERFTPPAKNGNGPAVLLLYGSNGLAAAQGYRQAAQLLATQGYHVFFPHYFDATGTKAANWSNREKDFRTWLAAVTDAITWAASQPGVDPERVGVVGFSLGAYLGLTAGALDERIDCVVDYFGGLPELIVPAVKRMPPVLILHGDADRVVPVKEAERLESFLKSRKIPHETKIYGGQGHGFDAGTALDVAVRTADFLERWLRRQKS